MKERIKMTQGLKYNPVNLKLVYDRYYANKICQKYNRQVFNEINLRSRLLKKLIHAQGNFWIKPPIYFDYGYNIYLGKNVMLNYDCVILDVCSVTIGNDTLIGLERETSLMLRDTVKKYQMKVLTHTAVQEIKDDQVIMSRKGKELVLDEIDTVVVAAGSKSVNDLVAPLEKAGVKITVVGDAKQVRNGLAAAYEGYMAGYQA